MDDIGSGLDLRRVLREHKRKEKRGYGYYSRLESLDKPVFALTAREQAKWEKKLNLKCGDVLVCAGERYNYTRVGGIDDGNVWVYGRKYQKNGFTEDTESRVVVWRKVLSNGRLGMRQPTSILKTNK